MKKNHLRFLILFFFTAFSTLQAQKPGFYVQGRFLYDKCGEKTILRGLNEMSVWASADPTGAVYMPEIRKTGANCVRIAWNIAGSLTTLDQTIQNCINNKMIPMIEIHDATGDWSKMPAVVAYWTRTDVVSLIKKHEQYLLVNIANEAGDGSESDAAFIQTYSNAIKSMRNAGIRTPLVIDANEYGKNLTTLDNTAAAILNADADKNVLFSVHLYWPKFNGATSAFITTELQKAVNAGFCLIVGEFSKYGAWAGQGVSICSTQGEVDYQTILQECQKHSIGWLAWSWGTASNIGGGDAKCVNMDMATNGKFSNLQAGWANEVAISSAFSIKNTSVTPKSILNGSCTTPTPVPVASYLTVKGASLTDMCGRTITLKGMNVAAHNWGYGPLTAAAEMAEIKKTGANAVRLVWYAQPKDANQTAYTMQNLEAIISLCAQNEIIPILELHDVTAKNDANVFQNTVVNWWKRTDVVALIKKHEKYLIVNIANEYGYCLWAGNTVATHDAFENSYKNAILQLRNAGIRVPIMVDAPDGGNSHEVLLERGQNLLASDPLKNIILSVHAYWARFKYNFDANNNATTTKPNYLTTIQTQIQNIKNSNLCFIIGEVANQQDGNSMCQYDITDVYKTVLTTAQTQNIGWLAWSWHYDGCTNRQMSNNRTATNLSVFGNDIVNNTVYGLKTTAKVVKFTCP